MARDFDRQVAEFQVRVAILNGFTALGMVPFSWGLTSMVYRVDLVEWEDGESWSLQWDERYSQRLGSLASVGDVWWCAASYAGVDYKDIGTPEPVWLTWKDDAMLIFDAECRFRT